MTESGVHPRRVRTRAAIAPEECPAAAFVSFVLYALAGLALASPWRCRDPRAVTRSCCSLSRPRRRGSARGLSHPARRSLAGVAVARAAVLRARHGRRRRGLLGRPRFAVLVLHLLPGAVLLLLLPASGRGRLLDGLRRRPRPALRLRRRGQPHRVSHPVRHRRAGLCRARAGDQQRQARHHRAAGPGRDPGPGAERAAPRGHRGGRRAPGPGHLRDRGL